MAEREELAEADLMEFTCPRCGVPAAARYWGPCPSCREELAASMRREARNVDVVDYEPRMNVVPNQVATKD